MSLVTSDLPSLDARLKAALHQLILLLNLEPPRPQRGEADRCAVPSPLSPDRFFVHLSVPLFPPSLRGGVESG